jgi:hypothetical protein
MNVFPKPSTHGPSAPQELSPIVLNSKAICLVYPNGDVVVRSSDQREDVHPSVIHL